MATFTITDIPSLRPAWYDAYALELIRLRKNRALQITPDDGESLRLVRVRLGRVAKRQNIVIKTVNVDGSVICWRKDRQ